MSEALLGARVRLSAPDGRSFDFFVADLVPYAGDTYVVLRREGKDEQLLITHLETDADSAPVFVVVEDETLIERVMEIRVAKLISNSIEAEHAHHHSKEDGCACGCGCDDEGCGPLSHEAVR